MTCCHDPEFTESIGESVFTVDVAAIAYGPGVLRETGARAAALNLKRVAVFTDSTVGQLEIVATTLASLRAAGIDAVVYDAIRRIRVGGGRLCH